MELSPEIDKLTKKKIIVRTEQVLLDFKDLEALVTLAKEQMMFPSWRNSNPDRTQHIRDILYRAELAEQERHVRCTEFARALGRWNQQQISEAVKSQLPRLSIVPEPE
jgi:hemerythrin superfamily protein